MTNQSLPNNPPPRKPLYTKTQIIDYWLVETRLAQVGLRSFAQHLERWRASQSTNAQFLAFLEVLEQAGLKVWAMRPELHLLGQAVTEGEGER